MEIFRHCPGCGRRFHIKLESKKMLSEHREAMPRTELTAGVARSGTMGGTATAGTSFSPLLVHEGSPIVVDMEEFQYMYKCGHCGHEWSETHFKSRRED